MMNVMQQRRFKVIHNLSVLSTKYIELIRLEIATVLIFSPNAFFNPKLHNNLGRRILPNESNRHRLARNSSALSEPFTDAFTNTSEIFYNAAHLRG